MLSSTRRRKGIGAHTSQTFRAASPLIETKRNIREAMELHLEAMAEVGEAIPEPSTDVDFVELQIVA